MGEEHVQRRLAAILAADVVGYSRLMGQDEAGTLASLKGLRGEVVDPKIAEHHGRVFKATGDGVLAEFPSVVNAVSCAVDIQRELEARNMELLGDRAIHLRIGVNIGDVVVEGEDVFGDGVNVAARLESIAPPGGVVISATAREHLGTRLDIQFEDMGEQVLKNIETPVRSYQAILGKVAAAEPSKSLSDKPSIAVLPFANMSDGPEQQYFSDGITEDIITEMARFRNIQVVARNSSFRYRGSELDMIRVGRELGVQYLVEGSVRRFGDRIRITAQLINTRSGHHLWAERFDRNQEELFAVQDQVVRTIVATVAGRLQAAGTEQAKQKPPASLAAYECVLRGIALPVNVPEAAAEARRLFQRAIELDQGYARAYGLLAHSYANEWFGDMSESNEALDRAFELANKAVAVSDNDAHCQGALGMMLQYRQSYELAEYYCAKALELNQNNPMLIAHLGRIYLSVGRPAEGLECLREAKRLDPFFDPSWYWPYVGIAYFVMRQYDDAISCLSRAPRMIYWAQAYQAACCALSDRLDRAKQHAAEVVRQIPEFSLIRFAAKEPYKLPTDRQHLVDGLRKSGLPE